jgi:hypothetical protein
MAGYWEDPDDIAIEEELAERGVPLDKLDHLGAIPYWTEVHEELLENGIIEDPS